MIVKGHHALGIVEEPEFKKLIELISQCPGYTLPTKATLCNDIMQSFCNEILNKIKIRLQSAIAVCLTTDEWTSKTNVRYLAVTAHYIDENTILTSNLIACEEFGNKHNAENLSTLLQKVASEFQITNKITAVINCKTANITAAVRLRQWSGISCFAYTLNLIVQAALSEVSDIVLKIKNIVEYFNKNTLGLKKLQETQKQMQLQNLKLKQVVVTRWNSTYEMLKRIVALKDAVISTLSCTRPDLYLPEEEWEVINEIILILEPFYDVTQEVLAEKFVPLSKVLILCNVLETEFSERNSSNIHIQAMITIIKKDLFTRFGKLEQNNLYAECTILDPRFKKLGFKNNNNYENAVLELRKKIEHIEITKHTHETLKQENNVNSAKTTRLWGKFDNFIKIVNLDNNLAARLTEFDRYLNEEYLDRRKDPLTWWKDRKHLYPRVYIYAIKRLCIVATSVPCESSFLATDQIINEKSTLISPNKVSKLTILLNNI